MITNDVAVCKREVPDVSYSRNGMIIPSAGLNNVQTFSCGMIIPSAGLNNVQTYSCGSADDKGVPIVTDDMVVNNMEVITMLLVTMGTPLPSAEPQETTKCGKASVSCVSYTGWLVLCCG